MISVCAIRRKISCLLLNMLHELVTNMLYWEWRWKKWLWHLNKHLVCKTKKGEWIVELISKLHINHENKNRIWGLPPIMFGMKWLSSVLMLHSFNSFLKMRFFFFKQKMCFFLLNDGDVPLQNQKGVWIKIRFISSFYLESLII